MASEYKSEETRIDYIVGITPEQTETRKQNKRQYLKSITPEQREYKNQRCRKYRKNMAPKQKERIKQYNQKYQKNMTPEQKERHKQCIKKYQNNMTPEQRERKKNSQREYQKKFTPEQRERINKRNRERYKKNKDKKLSEKFEIQEKSTTQYVPGSDQNESEKCINEESKINCTVNMTSEQEETKNEKKHQLKKTTPEQREYHNQWYREYRKRMKPEQKERKKQYNREYQKNMTLEQKERHKQNKHNKNMTPEQRERKNRMSRERYKKKRENIPAERFEIQEKSTTQNVAGSDQNIKDRLFFCYTCRQQFVDNTNLLHHIAMHISQPYVVVSKIDEFEKPLIGTEATNMDMEIQKRICDNILTNTVYIKTEKFDDFNEEETEMDINEFPFCIPIKKELDIKIESQNIE